MILNLELHLRYLLDERASNGARHRDGSCDVGSRHRCNKLFIATIISRVISSQYHMRVAQSERFPAVCDRYAAWEFRVFRNRGEDRVEGARVSE